MSSTIPASLEECPMSASNPKAAPCSCLPARTIAWLALALALVATPIWAAAEEAPRMDQALKQNAPKILAALTKAHAAQLEKNGHLNIGVLKFLVEKGKDKKDD